MNLQGEKTMPYCPKCDMEFIDGITTCTDCGGPLVESKEVADAMKQKEREEALARQRAAYEAMTAEIQDPAECCIEYDTSDAADDDVSLSEVSRDDDNMSYLGGARKPQAHIYVKKSQKYEDLKSSAAAFLLVGGLLSVFSALCWFGLIPLPLSGPSGIISKSVMTVMGLGSLYVAFTSSRAAKEVGSQISAEEEVTKQLLDWFAGNYSGARLDEQIAGESGELSPEELSLKRFDLIQDIIITSHDIADQAYVESLAEDIYGKLYED